VYARYNNEYMGLESRLTITRFLTLAKTQEADLHGDIISGVLAPAYLAIREPYVFVERFANHASDLGAVLRFTRLYGPLLASDISNHHKGTCLRGFKFPVAKWKALQETFRASWRMTTPASLGIAEGTGFKDWKNVGRRVPLGEGSFLGFHRNGAELIGKDLWTLIEVSFNAVPLERLRICKAPDCATPYFIAHHLRSTLCNSEKCKRWNDLRLKRETWHRNEKEYRAKKLV